MSCTACTGVRYPLSTYCGQCGERVVAYDPFLATTLDERFVIESKIAAGGFGAIYRARDLDGKELAIKVLHEQHNADPSVSARFRREALAMSSLRNPHTVTTFELGEDRNSGAHYIVMELLHGESLADRFATGGPLHWRAVLTILRQVCDSLAEAHALGIVHRDLKPANIYLCRDPRDFVKVLDFGIAKIINGSNICDDADLTHIGQAIGTLEYMSPEQLIGGALDARTDIYTLGVVAYEMISGQRPFGDVTGATGLMTALMTRQPTPLSTLSRGPLPPALDGVLLRCLEREAGDRYGSIRELRAAIDAMLVTRDDFNTTQRKWIRSEPLMIAMVEQDEETTWVDSKPPFDSKPPSNPPRDEPGGDEHVALAATAHAKPAAILFEDAVRSQVVRGSHDAPRMWRAQGTGTELDPSPFDLSDSAVARVPTGARALIASPYQIGVETTAEAAAAYVPPRFPVGSSPLIEDVPVRARFGFMRFVTWAVALTAVGLGVGMAIVAIAS